MQKFYIELGKEILKSRRERLLSRKALSEILKVGQMTIYNWEMGRCKIQGQELTKLMTLFKIKPSKFIE
mgnify:CR=1 FL=1